MLESREGARTRSMRPLVRWAPNVPPCKVDGAEQLLL
jgi:hypothetical protein